MKSRRMGEKMISEEEKDGRKDDQLSGEGWEKG